MLSGEEARQRDGKHKRKTLNQFRNGFSNKKVNQCVKSQEKPTEVFTIIKFSFAACPKELEAASRSSKTYLAKDGGGRPAPI